MHGLLQRHVLGQHRSRFRRGRDQVALLTKAYIRAAPELRLEPAEQRQGELRQGDVLRDGELLAQSPGRPRRAGLGVARIALDDDNAAAVDRA
jgi:hypothetical protein